MKTLAAAIVVYVFAPLPSHVAVAQVSSGSQASQQVSQQDTSGMPGSSLAQYFDARAGRGVDDLVTQALARNADLLATRQRVTEAQGLLRQAGFRPNPGFDTSFGTGAPLGSKNEREFSVGYNHIFELGGKRQRRVEVAERGAELAKLEIADRERQIRADVRSRYGQALAAIRNFSIVESLFNVTNQTLQLTSARVRTGESARLEQTLVQVEVGRLNSDRTLLENQVSRAILDLKPVVGFSLDEPLQLSGDLKADGSVKVTQEEAIARALRARPDLEAARLQEALTEAEVRAARAEAVPNLIASGRYARTNSAFSQSGLTSGGLPAPIRDTDNIATVGISVILPVRNRNQGLIQAAQARQAAAGLRRRFLEQVVAAEVRSAFTRYEAARKALDVFDTQVLDTAQNNVQIIRAAYTAGELRIFDVLNEQRRLVDTQRAYTDVLREYYLAIVELERAVGGPLR
jgi:outer membrane protein, heavy metal efflux system